MSVEGLKIPPGALTTGPLLSVTSASSLIVQLEENLPVIQEIPLRFLGQEDPLEKG